MQDEEAGASEAMGGLTFLPYFTKLDRTPLVGGKEFSPQTAPFTITI